MSSPDNTTPYASGDYDVNIHQTIPFYEEFHRQAVELVRLVNPQPRLWLDTGCGTGYLVSRALQSFPQTRFVLADPSTGMLNKARERLQGVSNSISFIEQPTGPPLAAALSDHPDVVTAMMCHHYSSLVERRCITEEVYKLLSPGGLYVTFENIRPASDRATQLALEQWRAFQLGQGRSAETVQTHLDRFDRAYFPITVQEHLNLLHDCGFSEAHLLWHSTMQAGFYAIKEKGAP